MNLLDKDGQLESMRSAQKYAHFFGLTNRNRQDQAKYEKLQADFQKSEAAMSELFETIIKTRKLHDTSSSN